MEVKIKNFKIFLKFFFRNLVWIMRWHQIRKAPIFEKTIPKRILILNGAHIGDVVITTSILPVLRSAYPDCEIGFVVGSWAEVAIHGHHEISSIHIVDHWWHNRSPVKIYNKYLQYRKTRKIALREIREVRYDLALCVYPFYLPDFMDLVFEASIPIRIGFDVSLFSKLASFAVGVPSSPFVHQSEIQAEVLKPLGLSKRHLAQRMSVLPVSKKESLSEVCQLLNVCKISDAKYILIHIGTGDPRREKSQDFWRRLAEIISRETLVIFTGHGKREEAGILSIIHGLNNCINACNKLSWGGFVAAVRHAEILYGVESMAGHVAAAVGTPCIVTYSGAAGVGRWRPYGSTAIVMSNHLPCSPCQLPWGCETMDCLQKISADEVIKIGWRNGKTSKF